MKQGTVRVGHVPADSCWLCRPLAKCVQAHPLNEDYQKAPAQLNRSEPTQLKQPQVELNTNTHQCSQ